jgi:hypothetical protein
MRLGYGQDNFPPSAPAVGKVDGGDGGVVTVSAFAVPSAVVQGDIEMAIIDQASTTNANNGFLNKGRNAMVATVETTTGRARKSKAKRETSIFVSPLFRYIVLLIVVPLIATLVLISTTTTSRLQDDLPLWLHDVEEASIALERSSIETTARLRGMFARETIAKPIRDLWLYQRVASWLFFWWYREERQLHGGLDGHRGVQVGDSDDVPIHTGRAVRLQLV